MIPRILKSRVTLIAFGLSVAAWVAAGCDRESKPAGSGEMETSPARAEALIPAQLFVGRAPANPRDVAAVKRSAREGDEVVVRGRIGGGKEPFVAGRAVFTLADPALPPCNQNPDDKCATPWDYCCEPADRIAAGTATVQVAGADGQALKVGLRGVHGLKPMAEVIVRGKVVRSAGGKVLVLEARELFVK